MRHLRPLLLLSLTLAGAAVQAETGDWTVKPEWVGAHEAFLASDALQGRGSGTRDEAIAAAYIAAQFQSYGLKPAPGMAGYVQPAVIPQRRLNGPASLSWGEGKTAAELTVFLTTGQAASGRLVAASDDPGALKALNAKEGDVLLAGGAAPAMAWFTAADKAGVKLVILRESEGTRGLYADMGGEPRLLRINPAKPHVRPALLSVPPALFDQLLAAQGQTLNFTPPAVIDAPLTTHNAIGYLAGSDPKAGTLLFTAHLDHLGVKPDGTIMHGANDDASGTVAVLELARALAAGRQPKRSILFVCYGAEELGMLGAGYFAEHPPVPLHEIIANLEFEMIGAQDPKLPEKTLMMTGFDRSDFGEALKRQGFRVTADPYPEQHFFQRSDNYQLALTGIVAHTVSGWAVTPTYHDPSDDLAHIDLPFMTAVIQSLIEPARWLANTDFVPKWKEGGKPSN
ncbi:MAG TPA: M20/M25/M40 family metallo-hydrolase [Burkholderiaceae bacterium]|jgi:hypothetical protein